jgi:hypothetical protein
MVEIARRILKYKAVRGEALFTPAFEAEIQLVDDINKITLAYVTEAQNHWKEGMKELGD